MGIVKKKENVNVYLLNHGDCTFLLPLQLHSITRETELPADRI